MPNRMRLPPPRRQGAQLVGRTCTAILCLLWLPHGAPAGACLEHGSRSLTHLHSEPFHHRQLNLASPAERALSSAVVRALRGGGDVPWKPPPAQPGWVPPPAREYGSSEEIEGEEEARAKFAKDKDSSEPEDPNAGEEDLKAGGSNWVAAFERAFGAGTEDRRQELEDVQDWEHELDEDGPIAQAVREAKTAGDAEGNRKMTTRDEGAMFDSVHSDDGEEGMGSELEGLVEEDGVDLEGELDEEDDGDGSEAVVRSSEIAEGVDHEDGADGEGAEQSDEEEGSDKDEDDGDAPMAGGADTETGGERQQRIAELLKEINRLKRIKAAGGSVAPGTEAEAVDAAKDVAPEAEESQGVSADDAELEQLMHHEAALDTEDGPNIMEDWMDGELPSPLKWKGELKRMPPVNRVSHLPVEERPFRCMFDGATFPTAEELFEYIRVKHTHAKKLERRNGGKKKGDDSDSDSSGDGDRGLDEDLQRFRNKIPKHKPTAGREGNRKSVKRREAYGDARGGGKAGLGAKAKDKRGWGMAGGPNAEGGVGEGERRGGVRKGGAPGRVGPKLGQLKGKAASGLYT
ncbi:hypothetical protein T484DRAFT_1934477 [Baffinella frigidus]|nr:hypothetical protein T484DRAFT_1934477 [Cryptophyta sp. CCMP2293]